MSTTFDTLTAARALKAAGIERRQAKAIACTVRYAAARETLARKADLAELESRLIQAALQAEVAGFLADLRSIRWMLYLIAAFLFIIGLRVSGLI